MFCDGSAAAPLLKAAPRVGGVRAARRRRAWLPTLLICCAVGLPASGCSLSFPLPGFKADTTATGSINAPDALLFKALDQEDWRRAKAAMAVALDPQGNGASVAWENPASGARGSFVAAAEPVPAADLICRDYRAHMVTGPRSDRQVTGSACRDGQGAWMVRTAAEIDRVKG